MVFSTFTKQLSPSLNSRAFTSCLYPHPFPSSSPCQLGSTFSPYGFTYPEYLIWMDSNNMGPFVTDFVHLDKCSRVKNPVSTSFLLTTEHYSAVGAHHILCIIPFYYSQGPFGRHSWVPILAIYSFIHYLLWSFSVCVHDTHVYICVLVCTCVHACEGQKSCQLLSRITVHLIFWDIASHWTCSFPS